MPEALFVLATGRCGTQWLASMFVRVGGDLADVRHEPVGNDYAAREMLARAILAGLDPELAEPILKHIEEIERVLRPLLHRVRPSGVEQHPVSHQTLSLARSGRALGPPSRSDGVVVGDAVRVLSAAGAAFSGEGAALTVG